nr:hypothetical protein [uncultured Kingella sp.]
MIIEPLVIQAWLAPALAVSGCIGLAKRQPEYPNARVILTFALFGGALGGLLMVLLDVMADALTGIMVVPFDFDFVLIVAMLLGAIVGCLPATLCGLILAWRRCVRSWQSTGFAAVVGGAASVLLMVDWALDGRLLACGVIGAITATILSALAESRRLQRS